MSAALHGRDIADAVGRIDARIDGVRERLNAADRLLGDGDTGMTVASVVHAWRGTLGEVPDDVGALLLQLGRATRSATGSSLGSVLAIGLTAAGKAATGKTAIDGPALASMLDAAALAIGARSGAAEGDKSILDSVHGVRRAIEGAGEASLLAHAIAGAQDALDAFRARESKLGRARIYGARSVGLDDPGMLAALELLQAAQEHA